MVKIKFKISYHNGDAKDNRLDMYDATVSLQGFAKALSISTHALLNDGEIRKKGNSINGAKIYISPSKKGSFEEVITLIITNKEAIGVSIAAAAFWDLIKWTWSKTLDLAYEPETPHVKRLDRRIEPFIGEMEEALEIPLEQAHRPIKQCEDMTIVLKRQKVGYEIRLDSNTLKSVSIQTDHSDILVVGNVTRFNILTGIGRFYDDQLRHTVSFKMLDKIGSSQRRRITWSLHNAQQEGEGKLQLSVNRVVSAKGVIRRYLVKKVSRI